MINGADRNWPRKRNVKSEELSVPSKRRHFQKAEAEGKLIRLATGDGMALIFFNNAEAPVKCVMEMSQALQSYPSIQLRMGVHSGPITSKPNSSASS